MAVIHNLSDPTNNLSGFDPVDGIADGTAVGTAYVVWKVLEGLRVFDSNWKLLTGSSPTPTFLQSEVSTGLVSAPATNLTSGFFIRMYKADDPGLAAATPSAFIYHFTIYSSQMYYGIAVGLYCKTSGGSIVTLMDAATTSWCGYSTSSDPLYTPYFPYNSSSSTTTVMGNIAKCIFWKSSNCSMIVGVNKSTNAYQGLGAFFTPSHPAVYRDTIGACTEGTNFDAFYGLTVDGCCGIELFTQSVNYAYNAGHSNISQLCSGGIMGSALLNWSSANQLISGKLRFGMYNNTAGHIFKSVSDEIEGVYVVHQSQAGLAAIGGIQILNNKYFMTGCLAKDRVNQRCLFYLEDV